MDNKLTFLIGVEDPGAEDDQDGSFKELHDAGQAASVGRTETELWKSLLLASVWDLHYLPSFYRQPRAVGT